MNGFVDYIKDQKGLRVCLRRVELDNVVKSGQFATYNDYHACENDLLINWGLYFFSNPRHFGWSGEI